MRALDVHFQLMQRLPVRTVLSKRKPPEPGVFYSDRKPGRGTSEEVRRMSRRIERMRAAGVERADIAEALNLSTATVDRYVALISTAAKAAKRR